MSFEVVFSTRSARQLDKLYEFIQADSGTLRAETVVNGIIAYCKEFDVFPERGAKREDLRPRLRVVGYKRIASIAFTVTSKRVVILGIYFGGQDLDTDLKLAGR